MTDLLGLVPESARAALGAWLAERGEPPYRTRQILPRLWQRPVASWEDATELPELLRRSLPEAFPLRRLPVVARQVSSDGTEKYLWDLGDGEAVESVLIPEGKRRTLCISSQVGCALGCVFCATGRMGFRGNLSAAGLPQEAEADREEVRPARRDRGAGTVPSPGDPRIRADRGDERWPRAGRSVGAAGATAGRAREPATAAPGWGPRPRSQPPRADARVRAAAAASRNRGGAAPQPWPRHQRGLRPATGGTGTAAQRPRPGARSRRVAGRCPAGPPPDPVPTLDALAVPRLPFRDARRCVWNRACRAPRERFHTRPRRSPRAASAARRG